MSLQLRVSGLDATAVDWKGNRHKTVIEALELDLTKADDQQNLKERLFDKDVVYVHFGPPCGTFSRARERPIPNNPNPPPPLRSEQEPYGLKEIARKIDRDRVESANQLVKFMGEIVPMLHAQGKFFTIVVDSL